MRRRDASATTLAEEARRERYPLERVPGAKRGPGDPLSEFSPSAVDGDEGSYFVLPVNTVSLY